MKFGSTSSKRHINSQTNSVFVIYFSFPICSFFSITLIQKGNNELDLQLYWKNQLASFIEYLKWQVIGTRKLQRKGRHSLGSQAIYNLIIV